jgi:hypothetical protein
MNTAAPDAPRHPTPAPRARSVAGPLEQGDRVAARWPALALGAVVVVAALGYGAAAQALSMPVLNPDELRYTLAARELAGGDWFGLRGHGYGYGAVYPTLLAPIVALSGSVEAAYPFFKAANALLFALSAVPIFFLARRLLSTWWSVGVAALSVAAPSSIYTSLVLTESAAYLTCSIALLALVLALERPSTPRQLALIGAVGLAYATRPQFAALLPAFLAAWVLLWAIDTERLPPREAATRLWPTLSALALAVAWFAGRSLLGTTSPEESLGGYGDLWRSYDVVSVARFAVYHLAGLELYLFVIPLAVAPVVVVDLLRAARRGSQREGAFVAAFLTVNAVLLLIAAAFASTPYGYSELHGRYLFYVAPLWLVAFGRWLSSGLPRPYLWMSTGVMLALALPAIPPYGLLAGNSVVEYVSSALWSATWTFLEGYPLVDGRRALAATVIVLAVAAAAVPRRLWPILPVTVAAGFVLSAAVAWERVADLPSAFGNAGAGNATWVDDAIPDGSSVTKLYLASARCPWTEETRQALFLTEFFNTSVDRVAAIGDSTSDGLPLVRVRVGPEGRLVRADGTPLVAHYVVTQPGIELEGRRIATGTGARLVLWEARGAVTLAEPGLATHDLATTHCV